MQYPARFIFYCAFLFLIQGCANHDGEGKNVSKDLFNEELGKASQQPRKNDTLFAGFRVGVSQAQYEKRLGEMTDGGKLTTIANAPCYVFKTPEREYTARLIPQFYHDSLYSIRMEILPRENVYGSIIYLALDGIYTSKYGSDTYKWSNDEKKEYEEHWLLGNITVGISISGSDASIEYKDIILANRKEKNDTHDKN